MKKKNHKITARQSNENTMEDFNDIPEVSQPKNLLGRWSDYFIDKHRVTFLLVLMILIWGFSRGASLQREIDPKVTVPMAIVTTTYFGASPHETEALLTIPMEEKLSEIDDVVKLTSDSGFGYSSIYVEFDINSDLKEKIDLIREKVSEMEGTLPEDADTPKVVELKTGDTPLLIFSLSGNADIYRINAHAEKIKDSLNLVKGVSDVEIIGDIEREISIIVDPDKLEEYGISMQEVHYAISQTNSNIPGGDVQLKGKNYNIRTIGRLSTIKEFEEIIIRHFNGTTVYLKDIASIDNGYKDQSVIVHKFNQEMSNSAELENAVIIAINKKQTADDIDVREDVLKVLEEEKLYPKDLKLTVFSDKAQKIDDHLGSVMNNAISGLLLVIVVLFIFIGLRESLIVSLVIPLSLLMALGFMSAFNISLNQVSMFALILAVGMMVDNAIVILENVDRLKKLDIPIVLAAKAGVNQIAPATLSSTLTTVAAFVPILLTTGVIGTFIKPIPMTTIFALASSCFVAITVTPSLCAVLLKGHNKEAVESKIRKNINKILSIILVMVLSMLAFSNWEETGLNRFGMLSYLFTILFTGAMILKLFVSNKKRNEESYIIQNYSKLLYWIINKTRRKVSVILLLLILFVSSVGLIPAGILKVEMFGGEDYTRMYINITTPPGSPLSKTLDIVEKVESKLNDIPEIDSFVSYAGSQGIDTEDIVQVRTMDLPNEGRLIIELKDSSERQKSSREIADTIRTEMKGISGAQIEVAEKGVGVPTGNPVEIKVKGDNLDNLKETAKYFEKVVASIDGTRNTKTSIGEYTPTLEIKVDKEKAAAYGLDEMSVALAVRNITYGVEATSFWDNQEEIAVVVKSDPDKLNTVKNIEDIMIYSRSGNAVPFTEVAELIETEGMVKISHDEGDRTISVISDINADEVTATEIVDQFKEEIKDYNLPDGVVYELSGEAEMLGDSFREMIINMAIAIILVFIILTVQFNSLSQPFIILLTVPMALIGVLPGLVVTGNNFGFFAFVGLVALVGIVVNDAIVLVDYINYLRQSGMEMKEAIRKTGETRFIPVMATTITTAGGILPLTLKDSFFQSFGVTIIFGLCMATVLTLIVVPTIYSIFEEQNYKLKEKLEAVIKA